jgi:hypothetical protein
VEDNGVEQFQKEIDTQHLQQSKEVVLTESLTKIGAANPTKSRKRFDIFPVHFAGKLLRKVTKSVTFRAP